MQKQEVPDETGAFWSGTIWLLRQKIIYRKLGKISPANPHQAKACANKKIQDQTAV